MTRTETEKTYLRAAVQNATAVGLVLILFDVLIGDLERAIVAMEERNVEKRSAELKHAFLVLQHLEGSLDMEQGGAAAKNFSRFYSAIRAKLLEGHIKIQPEILRRQIELLLSVRQAWQTVETANSQPAAAHRPASVGVGQLMAVEDEQAARPSWTA